MQSQTTLVDVLENFYSVIVEISGRAGAAIGVTQVNIKKEKMKSGKNKNSYFLPQQFFLLRIL